MVREGRGGATRGAKKSGIMEAGKKEVHSEMKVGVCRVLLLVRFSRCSGDEGEMPQGFSMMRFASCEYGLSGEVVVRMMHIQIA